MPLNKRLFTATGKFIFCSLFLLCLGTIRSQAELVAQVGEAESKLTKFQEGRDKLEPTTGFAGVNGLFQFALLVHQEPMEAFQADLERIIVSTDSVIYPLAGTSFNLPYKNNSLRFYVAASDYNGANQNRFQFWLEGYDDSWSTWKKEPFKEYTQIPEGTYILHVKGKNAQGVISKEALYTFSISPPWYRTGSLYFIYLICAGAAIYALIRWRHSELEAEKAYLEQVVYRFNNEVAEKNKEINRLTEELAFQNEKLQELDRLKTDVFEHTS